MNYKVETIPEFEKEAKKLAKKYASIKFDLAALVSTLKSNPVQGTDLGSGILRSDLPSHQKIKANLAGAGSSPM